MEDQDRETRGDEDVEGHANKGQANKGVNLEPDLDNNLGRDDEDDVEAHKHKNVNLEPSLDNNLGQNLARDDEDDVEGHMVNQAVNLGKHKA